MLLHNASQFATDFDHLFNQLRRGPDRRRNVAFPLNGWDAGDAFIVEAEAPGWSLDNLEILVHGQELTIHGSRSADADDSRRWLRRERLQGDFQRTLTLPTEVDGERVEATLKDGVLRVTLPKAAAVQPRRIEVKGL